MTALDQNELYKLLGVPSPELKAQVAETVAQTLNRLAASNIELEIPEVRYDLKGRVAGYAFVDENAIRLNTELLYAYTDDMLRQTVPHEIAHLAAFKYWPKHRPHGDAWQLIMTGVLGLPADRCHAYETKPAKVHPKPWHYTCPCGTDFYLTNNMHSKVQLGSVRICRKCKGQLIFVGRLTDNEG